MGLFDKIKSFFGIDEQTVKIGQIDKQIRELSNKQTEISSREPDKKPIDLDWYKIEFQSNSITDKYSIFTPFKLLTGKTMRQIADERFAEEQERLRRLEAKVCECFEDVSRLIKSENVEQAEDLLLSTASPIKELDKDYLEKNRLKLTSQLQALKDTLREREIRRLEEERQRQLEEQRRREQLEQERREREEREREEREREAREYEEKLKREEDERNLEISRLKNLVSCKKENASEILSYLKSHGVYYFYHFTDKRNLDSIRRNGGLYSWYYSKNHDNIKVKVYGGSFQSQQLDVRHGLKDYVRLSFCNDHPMAWRLKQEGSELVLLKISIDVAAFQDTLFSDINAADTSHRHGGTMDALKMVNIRATQASFVSRNDPIFHEHQAECMVKTFVPIEYIVNIDNPSRI